jgi:DinB superfamily
MSNAELDNLKFPVGKYSQAEGITEHTLQQWITELSDFPVSMENLILRLSIEELEWPYRPGGWNIRQVVHHCADSHMNSLIRFKLALTEENPVIKPYEEQLWAELPDYQVPVSGSLNILKGVHSHWVVLLKNLTEAQFNRTFIHPASNRIFTLKEALGLYAWHSKHHLAHIKQALKYQGKFD